VCKICNARLLLNYENILNISVCAVKSCSTFGQSVHVKMSDGRWIYILIYVTVAHMINLKLFRRNVYQRDELERRKMLQVRCKRLRKCTMLVTFRIMERYVLQQLERRGDEREVTWGRCERKRI
jgi:hypothetical protein